MLKKLLLATTVCIALSACNDSSSSSSSQQAELESLKFTNVDAVSSIARKENSDDSYEHLIGYDKSGYEYEVSNLGVDNFTPVTGGFVVEVTEPHQATYKYTQGLAPVDESIDGTINKVLSAITEDKPIVDVEQTFHRPVWYYVNTDGNYFLISSKRDLPSFMGENSQGLLVFSDGETFDLNTQRTGQLINDVELDAKSITDAISAITNKNQDESESVKEVLINLLQNNKIEKAKEVSLMNGDSLLAVSSNVGEVLIESTTTSSPTLSPETICADSESPVSCKATVAGLNTIIKGVIKLTQKVQGLGGINQLSPIPNTELTLTDRGLLDNDGILNTTYSEGWDGESALASDSTLILSTSLHNIKCSSAPKLCLYSVTKPKALSSDPITIVGLATESSFNTGTYEGQIEGGQQNYLWVNDSYIVIKEASQISIIDRTNSNTLLAPILVGTEIDTINLTDDSKLYITATDSSGQPAAYIYDIVTGNGLDSPITNEKLSAFKALIK